MIKLRCEVIRTTFHNPSDQYTVLSVKVKGYEKPLFLVGHLLEFPPETILLCEGNWVENKQFGTEFEAKTWKEILPDTQLGLEKYLSSRLVNGVGPKYARLIVQHFGLDTLNVLDNDIWRLQEVPHIGRKRLAQIQESWTQQKDIKDVMLYLQSYGVTSALATKIFQCYGSQSIEKVKENPYRLAEDIAGIGFEKADQIAHRMGYHSNDLYRCRSGLLYVMKEFAASGHVFAEQEQLVQKAMEILHAEREVIGQAIAQLVQAGKLKTDNEAIYLPSYFRAEVETAERLLVLLESEVDTKGSEDTEKNFSLDLSTLFRKTKMTYDEIQMQAIETALRSKVMILTGGPGTGKTTTTQGIIAAFQQLKLKVLLAAPTGRAAKRMNEATGLEAKTIHRLLEYNPIDGFQRNEENPLEGDALIVDECSMIDILLIHRLLQAVPASMRVVLVGDVDQLPSVGAGNVLRDLIECGKIPVVCLKRIFRQAQTSRIVRNAHAINQGLFPDISNGKQTDFFFIEKEKTEAVAQLIIELVQERLPRAYGVSPKQIQVLTPIRDGVVGTHQLNAALQQALNPAPTAIHHGGVSYRMGDRVMQMQNDYDKRVFNGDLGYIEAADPKEHTLQVNLEGRIVKYKAADVEELSLAYATTIHKSQGSEYPIVIIPVVMSHYRMLQRNLIYTGITRAKQLCILIGTHKALSCAIQNIAVLKRNTKLKERLNHTIARLFLG